MLEHDAADQAQSDATSSGDSTESSGSTSGPDLSDYVPKKRFSGVQRENEKLRREIASLRGQISDLGDIRRNTTGLEDRLNALELAVAGVVDSAATRYSEDDTVDEGTQPTRARESEVDRVRRAQQERVSTSRQQAIASRLYQRIRESMELIGQFDQNDPDLQRATQLWNEGAQFGDQFDEVKLLEAEQIVATKARQTNAASHESSSEDQASQDKAGDQASDSTDSDSSGEDTTNQSGRSDSDGGDEEAPAQTPRQRVRDSGVAAGQGGRRSTGDESWRELHDPLRLLEQHHEVAGREP